jgi:hypothetical protein
MLTLVLVRKCGLTENNQQQCTAAFQFPAGRNLFGSKTNNQNITGKR